MTNPTWSPEPHQMVDVGHSRLAYWRLGAGPDLVFIHGWPVHSGTFRHLLPGLTDRFTCHLFDLPGAGQSEWSRESRIGLEQHAASLATAIDALGIDRYGVVAHDSGAAIGRLLAAEHGARVWGSVMGNTEIPGHRPWQVKVFIAARKLPGGAAALGGFLGFGPLRRSRLGLGACFEDPTYGEGEFLDLFIAPLARSRRAMAGQMRLVDGFDWRVVDGLADVHARIEGPVKMVWGPDDTYFPIDKAQDTLPQFPGGAELVSIPGARLFAHEDHAGAFLAEARPFLEQCATT